MTFPLADPESVKFELVPERETGLTLDEAYALLTGTDTNTFGVPMPMPMVAAAEVHTGAMIALVPSADDAARLAVAGGEPNDQLHVTLVYLGDVDDISPNAKRALVDRMRALAVDALKPVEAEGFAVSVFNPPGTARDDGKDRDTCIVLGLSGETLAETHTLVENAVRQLQRNTRGLVVPAQHQPWVPHVTLVYTDDVARVTKLVNRTGPVMFDRLRLAFGGENVDVPLTAPVTAAFNRNQKRDDQGRWSETGTPAVSKVDEISHTDALAMQSNMMAWSDKQKKTLHGYTGIDYKAVNNTRRKLGVAASAVLPQIGVIRSAMSPLPRQVQAFRETGIASFGVETLEQLKKLVGKTIRDRGFMSTTISPYIHMPGKGVRVQMNITVPKGIRAAYVAGVSASPHEHELLLDADTKFRIDRIEGSQMWVTVVD